MINSLFVTLLPATFVTAQQPPSDQPPAAVLRYQFAPGEKAHYRIHHRGALRMIGTAAWVVAAAMVVAMLVFLIDVVAVVDMRPPEARRAIVLGGLLQEAKYATAALVLIVLGTGARREGGD